ncbi:DAK2 domain-containing protein [Streptomyces sp. 184]|uniref:DAK2 domain-containing protein n=1 Tax=Streptomyces sp. 184 TaxID=1827526 RepID=UPI003891EC43
MQVLDAESVRAWCVLALEALGRGREEIDAVNVFPVADGDTGTNLYLTVESAAQAVDAVYGAFTAEGAGGGGAGPAVADVLRGMAHGALIGARGNSGTILAELLRGLTGAVAAAGPGAGSGAGAASDAGDGALLAVALRRGADAARAAVEHPVEGTMLTVADAAAAAAEGTGASGAARVARAAYDGAREALAATTGQLDVLRRAGVVDAGGLGLVAVLGTLADALSGAARPTELGPEGPAGRGPGSRRTPARHDDGACAAPEAGGGGPAYEVIYLLEADDAAVARLRPRLDGLGDSLVVGGGDGLWRVHVHVDDAGAAVEAGVEAGRPYRIQITHLPAGAAADAPPRGADGGGERAGRAVVAVVPGDGLAALCTRAGAGVVTVREGEPPASGELAEAMRRTGAHEVVLLPNDAELRHTAAVAVAEARASGVRAALVPTRAAVQGLAALAVHDPGRRFDEDVVSMTAAAGATRHAELAVAEQEAWTTAGICRPGDVLGVVEGDVAVVGGDLAETAEAVLDRMLAGGGELVTLVLGPDLPPGFGARLEAHVRGGHLAVDTVVYEGGSQSAPLLIGVE